MSSSHEKPVQLDSTHDIEQHATTEPIRPGPSFQLDKAPHVLERTRSHAGNEIVADEPHAPDTSEDIYNKFSPRRKIVITTVLSLCGFLAPIASTTVLSAVPEVSATYKTTGTIINVSQALFLVGMGLSPCFWGPLAQIYGRRWVRILHCGAVAILMTVRYASSRQRCSRHSPLAPRWRRILCRTLYSEFSPLCKEHAFFLWVLRASVISISLYVLTNSTRTLDLLTIMKQTERGTALGWFLSGTLVGPAFGPFIGGIIVTYTSWRAIFWLQTVLGGIATLLVFFFLPETIHRKKSEQLEGLGPMQKALKIAAMTNPTRVLRFFAIPNLIAVVSIQEDLIHHKPLTFCFRAWRVPPLCGTCMDCLPPFVTS